MRFGVMFRTGALAATSRFVMVSVLLSTTHLVSLETKAAEWTTVEVVRTEEMSDTASPVFRGKDEKGAFGSSKITLRCADEGWGSVSLERVRGRFALDHELGLKSWPELNKALEKQSDAYLRGERLKFREIFVHDDSGPRHPRDELAAFGDSETGFKYKFAKFDECSKVDSETLKPGQTCVVTLQVKGASKRSGASGHVRYRYIKCEPNPIASSTNEAPSSAVVPVTIPSTNKNRTTP